MDGSAVAFQALLLLVFLSSTVRSLRCYNCNQRGSTMERCHHGSTIENCSATFPHRPAVCLKIVRTFASGRPSAVFAACDLREEFSESVLGACHVAPKPKESNSGDRIQMCICMSDLCNRGATLRKSSIPSLSSGLCFHVLILLTKRVFWN